MDLSSINTVAVLVAAAVAFVIGFLWHGPLFGQAWLKMMNVPQSEVDAMKAKGMGAMLPHMIGAFVQQIIVAIVMGYVLGRLGITDAMGAAVLAFMLWLGFVASIMLNTVLWEKRTWDLYLFNITYHLVSLIAVAEVMVYMG